MDVKNAANSGTMWCKAVIGKDNDGRWEAILENDRIFVRYGCKRSENNLEGMITELRTKEYPDENQAGHLLEAAAHRGLITSPVSSLSKTAKI